MQFLTQNQHMITTFSSQTSNYTKQNFRLGTSGEPNLWLGMGAPYLPRTAPGHQAVITRPYDDRKSSSSPRPL